MTQRCNLLWLDLEMTGLNPDTDAILEIAVIATDSNLENIIEGPSLVIHQSDAILNDMNSWCKEHHGVSGLIDRVRASTLSLPDAEQQVIDFINDYCVSENLYLAGNSIHQDRIFMRKYMPTLDKKFHYRMVDVSSVKVLVQQWYANNPASDFKKSKTHRALDDIKESIAELREYRKAFFV